MWIEESHYISRISLHKAPTKKKVAEVSETQREVAIMQEMDDEVPVPTSDRSSEITPIETNLESEKETSSEEENNKNGDEPCYSKTTKVEEMPTQSLVAKPEKVAKQKEWQNSREWIRQKANISGAT